MNSFFAIFTARMRMNIPILLAIIILLMPSCLYSDSELYQVEPVPGDPPVISVYTNLDTLVNPAVNDSLEVIYDVEIEGGDLYYVYAEIASTQIFESDSIHGSFWINHSLAEVTGLDTLLMDFYYSSNSNTLADIVGYEALIKHLKFMVDFNLEVAK
jgi:hypothetical protein